MIFHTGSSLPTQIRIGWNDELKVHVSETTTLLLELKDFVHELEEGTTCIDEYWRMN